ncbi:MAG: hypothetical protein PHF29_07285 [Candidatus Riflebacteria bacterium]|nr:hypothetical protein [Candidatus Riflebacteria bacterium]
MRKMLVYIAFLLSFSIIFVDGASAQDLDYRFLDAIKALETKFGTVLPKSINEQTCELSFSAPYNKICELIASVDNKNIQIEKVTVFGRDKDMAAIALSIVCGDNLPKISTQKVSAFCNLCKEPQIPWVSNKGKNKNVTVTTIETGFADTVTIKGIADKSGLVFSDLFPILNGIRSISAPFFERGKFFDTEDGRKMEYTLQCKWGTKY